MRKVLKPIIIIAVAVSALISICVILHYSGSGTPVFKIFGSLDELSCFDSYDTSEIPDRSDLVEGLTIKDKRCFEVDFNGTAYSIYAYVFETPEDAERPIEVIAQAISSVKTIKLCFISEESPKTKHLKNISMITSVSRSIIWLRMSWTPKLYLAHGLP